MACHRKDNLFEFMFYRVIVLDYKAGCGTFRNYFDDVGSDQLLLKPFDAVCANYHHLIGRIFCFAGDFIENGSGPDQHL